MDDDVKIKLIFTAGMVLFYAIVFLTQKLDTATASALVSAFTNALIGIFAYNYVKKYQQQQQGASNVQQQQG